MSKYIVIEATGEFDATNRLNEAHRRGYYLHSFQFQFDEQLHGAMLVLIMERPDVEAPGAAPDAGDGGDAQ